jgi:flagellar basal-body rod protein FlgB
MLTDLPLISVIKNRMQYHQARQKQLAENVANADSPGYKPRDLKPFDILVAAQTNGSGAAVTNANHISAGGSGRSGVPDSRRASSFESTPSGNAVNLEDEMLRMSQNASDFQLASTLYSKSLSYLRIALGKRG